MVWFNLQITEHIAKYSPVNAIKKEFEYCDSQGNKLKYIKGSRINGYYENDRGERVEDNNVFLFVNNKPMAKFDKTKMVNRYKEVDLEEKEDLIVEHKYLMYCDSLLNYLNRTGKAIKFGFSNGGKSSYIAYCYPSKLYNGFLFMDLGISKISDSVKPKIEGIKEKQKAEQLNLNIQGIEKLNVEDMIEL